jgi:hypothetical protein
MPLVKEKKKRGRKCPCLKCTRKISWRIICFAPCAKKIIDASLIISMVCKDRVLVHAMMPVGPSCLEKS